MQRRVSLHTLKAYEGDLWDFQTFIVSYKGHELQHDDLAQLSIRDFRSWLADRHHRGLSHRSNARALSALRTFFRYLDQQGVVPLQQATVFSVKQPRFQNDLPKHLPHITIEELLSQVFKGEESSPLWIKLRDWALLTLLYGTGLRISEALALNQDMLSRKDDIRVQGKGSKTRIVPLLPLVKERLALYVQHCPWHQNKDLRAPLFYGVRGGRLTDSAVRKFLVRLRRDHLWPEHTTPHAMRHSFATALFQSGADLRVLQDLLGHASLNATQIYAHTNIEHILPSYQHKHPLGEA